MKAIYNQKYIDFKKISINPVDRAFQYGDGFFETIIYRGRSLINCQYHLERVAEAMKVLYMKRPFYMTDEYLTDQTLQLIKINNHSDSARIKWMIWRKDGGLYTPRNNEINLLIISAHHESPFINPSKKISFSTSSKVYYSKHSGFKTLNSLDYVLAGIERVKRDLDDLILLNNEGHIAECIASNIFWINQGYFYTPSLQSGCIKGVMRSHILSLLLKKNIRVVVGLFPKDNIMLSESVFLCNAAGIYPVHSIDDTEFDSTKDLTYLDPLN